MALQAKGIDPTAQGNGLADQRLIDKAAVVRAHTKGNSGPPGRRMNVEKARNLNTAGASASLRLVGNPTPVVPAKAGTQ
ncbi:hypothetical protein GCM10011408_11640 [Dyella caseinilytica]|nr:hypothetical protein GCM10011408_11640 [Dyella caseinilytica]